MANAELYELVNKSMRAELVSSVLAQYAVASSSVYSPPPSQYAEQLAQLDRRFSNWPAALAKSHLAMYALSHRQDPSYWRVRATMPVLEVNPSLPKPEQLNVAGLAELILLSRVRETATGDTRYPTAPTSAAIREEWAVVHTELGGGDTLRSLPNASWPGIIHALIDGETRIGDPIN